MHKTMIKVFLFILAVSQFSFAEKNLSETDIEKWRLESEAYLSQLDGDWQGKISGLELDRIIGVVVIFYWSVFI